ncbi:hypothetical protein D3C87_77900 [compost metagenome]
MFVVRNISPHNIIINEKSIAYDKTTKVTEDQLENLQSLIQDGLLKVESKYNSNVEQTNNEELKEKFEEIKNRIVPAFFSLHFNQDLSNEELQDLKWFFKNIGPTSKVNNNLKELLDSVKSTEEFIEVLLNHLYPELIKINLK